ncbi:MAG TPA: sulfotransferase [Candidatus Binatia bacterium]|jgi:hypothetical protein|nr:sulfotransferase [Candidatus Binatia bacterium]
MRQAEPIFITGADRSGTSLIYALLASHPNISMVRRTNMWRWFYGQYGDLAERENFERCLETMLRYYRLDALQPDAERIRREFWQGAPSYGHLFALFHGHHAERLGKSRWGDKSLHTEHHAAQIFAEFPEARIIHMVRDPRDRYASVLKRYDDSEKGVAATTGRWLASTRQAQRNLRMYPDKYMALRYETLAQQPERTVQEVCAFIGEDYAPEMLAMKGAPEYRESGGNSSFTRFRPGTISTRSIGRYRKVVGKQDLAFIQFCAGSDMARFDYEREAVDFLPAERLRYYSIELPTNLVRLAGWLALQRLNKAKGTAVPESRLRPVAQALS